MRWLHWLTGLCRRQLVSRRKFLQAVGVGTAAGLVGSASPKVVHVATGGGSATPSSEWLTSQLTDRTRDVLKLAHREARRLNSESAGGEHVLLGLLREGRGIAFHALKLLEADVVAMRRDLHQRALAKPESIVRGASDRRRGAGEIIEDAAAEAQAMSVNYVGTEHLLLGLMRAPEDAAAEILEKHGLDHSKVLDAIVVLLGGCAPSST